MGRSRSRGLLVASFSLVLGAVAAAQVTTRVSVSSTGAQGNGASTGVAITSDGRWILFNSEASNLVDGDTNGVSDMFVHDRQTGLTERIDLSAFGSNIQASAVATSGDARFVAFVTSQALVPQDQNGSAADVYVLDRLAGIVECVSVSSSGEIGSSPSGPAWMSPDGRWVAFRTFAYNFFPNDLNHQKDIFVRDRAAGTTTLASASSTGVIGNAASLEASISDDGRFVAFVSRASNLGPAGIGDHNVFLRDMLTGTTTALTFSPGNFYFSANPAITGDGRYVAFMTNTNLIPEDRNSAADVYVYDQQTGIESRVSVSSAGHHDYYSTTTNGPSISANGRWIAFHSPTNDLVPGDTVADDCFVHDRDTASTVRISVSSTGHEGGGTYAFISRDGRSVMFGSTSPDLVADDTNGVADVFVRDVLYPSDCSPGVVNSGVGPVPDVLRVNGSAGDARRVVSLLVSSPIQVSLDAAPAGPGGPGNALARYELWVWVGYPTNPYDFTTSPVRLGCTVNPLPSVPLAMPQPLLCLRGTDLPSTLDVCAGLSVRPSPDRAPWTRTKASGFAGPRTLTLQGIVEDSGAGNASGFSVTNAVVLQIHR